MAERRDDADQDATIRLATAVDQSPAAVSILRGRDLAVEYANPAHQRLFPCRIGASLRHGEPSSALTTLLKTATEVLDTGRSGRCDEVLVAAQHGGQRFLNIACSLVAGSAASRLLVVGLDVTDQLRSQHEAEEERERLTVLDRVTTAVGRDTNPRRELIALAESVVPVLADACAIYLMDRRTPSIQAERVYTMATTRVVAIIDPARGVARPAQETNLRLPATGPIARAAIRRQPATVSRDGTNPADWGERWMTRLNPHSVVAVPVRIDEAVQAVISFAGCGTRPRYQDSDVALMREISSRADAAVERAVRLQQTTEIAAELQRGLLSDPPVVEGLDIAARYRPAGVGLEVGGDWYDAVVLPTGEVAITIGDVVGHDLYAVRVMGQLRSMVQALAFQPGSEPAGLVTTINRLSHHQGIGEFTTIIHGRVTLPDDAGPATLTWTNAGHPPPLMVDPGGGAAVLGERSWPLLGLPQVDYGQERVAVPPGARLLFYTDGLIEDPKNPSRDAVGALADLVSGCADLDNDELCDRLVAAAPTRDDIALLVVRRRP